MEPSLLLTHVLNLEVEIDISQSTPYTNLLSNVLIRAVCDLSSKSHDEKTSALTWFNTSDPEKAFSFLWILSNLNMEGYAEKIRVRANDIILNNSLPNFQHPKQIIRRSRVDYR